MEKYLKIKLKEFKNKKHQRQWQSTLSRCGHSLYEQPESAINVEDIKHVLEPIWLDKTETATRVRGRIEKIIDWAIFQDQRNGDNPARWKGNLELLLQKPAKIQIITPPSRFLRLQPGKNT